MASWRSADPAEADSGARGPERRPLLPARVTTALDRVDSVIMALCSALMIGSFGVVIVAVFCRYVLNASLMWGEELARYLAIWMICLGLGLAHRRGAHVAVNSALSWFPKIPRRVVTSVSESVTLLMCILVTWFSWLAAQSNFQTGQLSPALGIDIAWIYLAIPVGFFLMSVQSLIRLISPRDPDSEEETF